jgi:hypothetical protein
VEAQDLVQVGEQIPGVSQPRRSPAGRWPASGPRATAGPGRDRGRRRARAGRSTGRNPARLRRRADEFARVPRSTYS